VFHPKRNRLFLALLFIYKTVGNNTQIMLKTKNVFLDTETFVANGYFSNNKLNTLAEYGKNGTINIYLSEITKEEVKSNIKEDLMITIQQINHFKKEIHRKGRILRNIDGFNDYLNLPKLDSKIDFEKVINSLEEFIKLGMVKTLPYDLIDVGPIFSKYFKKEKPFGEGKKKYEFPDAILLVLIENWCIKNNQKTYLISSDTDILNIESDYIIPVKNIGKFLGFVNRQELINAEKFEWIEQIFIKNQNKISKSISEHFVEKIKDEYYSDIKISEVEVENIEFFDFSIIDEQESVFILQMDVDISFSLLVSYTDYANSHFDREDDKWYYKDIQQTTISFDDTITVEIEIEAEFDERNEPEQYIDINCIYTSVPNEDRIENRIMDY
jgi:hypothetical protein